MAIDPNHTVNAANAAAAAAAAGARPLRPIAPAPAHLYTAPMRVQSSPGAVVYPSARPPFPSALNFHSHPQPHPQAQAQAQAQPHPYPQPHLHPQPAPPPAHQSPLPPPIRFSGLVAPPSSSVPDSNGIIRDKARDDTQFVIQDRKVRITDGASLYALCRSWLRNGTSEESQPRYGDATSSLPRPSPIPMASATPPKKEDGDKKEEKEDKDEESVEHASPKDLLKRHIKRARKVRARLREERSQRITRYKARLALLLHPLKSSEMF